MRRRDNNAVPSFGFDHEAAAVADLHYGLRERYPFIRPLVVCYDHLPTDSAMRSEIGKRMGSNEKHYPAHACLRWTSDIRLKSAACNAFCMLLLPHAKQARMPSKLMTRVRFPSPAPTLSYVRFVLVVVWVTMRVTPHTKVRARVE